MSEMHWLPVSWIMNISQASSCSKVQGKEDPYLLRGDLCEVGSDICSSEGSWLLPLSDSCQSPFPLTYDTSWSELHCNCHLLALLTSWSECERRRASQSQFWVIRGWICTHQHHLEELTASEEKTHFKYPSFQTAEVYCIKDFPNTLNFSWKKAGEILFQRSIQVENTL